MVQTLTRGARPDSNSRPLVQISSPLSSRYALWEHLFYYWYSIFVKDQIDVNLMTKNKYKDRRPLARKLYFFFFLRNFSNFVVLRKKYLKSPLIQVNIFYLSIYRSMVFFSREKIGKILFIVTVLFHQAWFLILGHCLYYTTYFDVKFYKKVGKMSDFWSKFAQKILFLAKN